MGRKRTIAVADAETDPFKRHRIPKPFLWGYYNGDEIVFFRTTEEFVDFISERDEIIYFHNGGKFDFHFLTPFFNPFDEEMLVINGRIVKIKIGIAELRDSYVILPMPLSDYIKDKIDYAIFEKSERDKPKNRRAIEKYLEGDLIYLYELVTGFAEKYGRHLTIAGASMKNWAKLMETNPPKTNVKFYEDIKRYYYGGRVECFDAGILENGPFIVIDINSAYPYHMESKKHPISTSCLKGTGIPPAIKGHMFFTLECISKGAFPYREKTGLVFPNDNVKRVYNVTGWELLTAKKLKLISNVTFIEWRHFSERIDFSKYVNKFWVQRKEHKRLAKEGATEVIKRKNKAEALFDKFLLNSLYGKFGANPDNYSKQMLIPFEHIPSLEEPDENGDKWLFCGTFGESWAVAERKLRDEEKYYYNVATAASITGAVRAQLLEAKNQCEGVLYCDTDSIICRKVAEEIEMSPELGAWETEGVFDKGAICGKKLYLFYDSSIIKDISKIRAEQRKETDGLKMACKGVLLAPKDILEIASGKEILYETENPTFSLNRKTRFTDRKIKSTAKKS